MYRSLPFVERVPECKSLNNHLDLDPASKVTNRVRKSSEVRVNLPFLHIPHRSWVTEWGDCKWLVDGVRSGSRSWPLFVLRGSDPFSSRHRLSPTPADGTVTLAHRDPWSRQRREDQSNTGQRMSQSRPYDGGKSHERRLRPRSTLALESPVGTTRVPV